MQIRRPRAARLRSLTDRAGNLPHRPHVTEVGVASGALECQSRIAEGGDLLEPKHAGTRNTFRPRVLLKASPGFLRFDLIYRESFALTPDLGLAMRHAWVLDQRMVFGSSTKPARNRSPSRNSAMPSGLRSRKMTPRC